MKLQEYSVIDSINNYKKRQNQFDLKFKGILSKKKANLKKKKFKLIDNQNRSKLSEGRNYGMGFAFAKREGNNLKTVMPITACKDFLNDQLYSELTNKSYSIYGLNTKKENIFEFGEAYLILSILKTKGGYDYETYQRDYDALKNNYICLEKYINWFEKQLKVKEKTVIYELQENKYVCIVPMFWLQSTYMLSFYTLLLRVGMFYQSGKPLDYLAKFNQNDEDVYFLNSIKNKVTKILSGKLPKQNINLVGCPHDLGICHAKF